MLCFISIFTTALLISPSLGVISAQKDETPDADSLDSRKHMNFGSGFHEFNAHEDMYVPAMDLSGFRIKRRHFQNEGYYCSKSRDHLEFTNQSSVKNAAKKACKGLERSKHEHGHEHKDKYEYKENKEEEEEEEEEDDDEYKIKKGKKGKKHSDYPHPYNAVKYVKYPPPYFEHRIHDVKKGKSGLSVIIDIDCHIVDVVALNQDKRYHQCARA